MKILIRNNAQLPNKILRFIKWKLYTLGRKFKHLHYAEIHLSTEGQNPKTYKVNTRLGIPGNDVILNHQSKSLQELLQLNTKAYHRYLNKSKLTSSNK